MAKTQFSHLGGVAEVFTDPDLAGYITKHFSSSDLDGIVSNKSMQKRLEVLNNVLIGANFPSSFTSDVYKSQKIDFVNRLSGYYPGRVKQQTMTELGFKKKVKRDKKIKYKQQKKRLKQKSSKGHTYSRGYKRWTKKEEYILKSYKGKSNKEISTILAKNTGVKRSISSIKRKRTRL